MKSPYLAKNLRQRMDAFAMSQSELADRTGLSQAQISSYLSGSYNPTSASLRKLAEALRCDPDELLGKNEIQANLQTVYHQLDQTEAELLRMYRSLSVVARAKAIAYIGELAGEE